MYIIIQDDIPIKMRVINKEIKAKDGQFPAIKDIFGERMDACSICPIWEVCEGNNEFDCSVYGMFDGGNFYLSDLIKVCEESRKYRQLLIEKANNED